MFKIPLSAKQIALILLVVVVLLTAASITGQYYKIYGITGDPVWLKVIDKFDLDIEANNFPTWYQSATLLLSAFLLATVALIRKNLGDTDSRYWIILSAVFAYLSMDESVAIHEQFTLPLRDQFHFEGFWYLSWVIPAIIFLLIFFVSYLKFLFRLSARVRFYLIASGAVYIFGAVAMEMLGGKFLFLFETEMTGTNAFIYAVLTDVEEFFEMLGILLFIFTLFDYLQGEAFLPAPAGDRRAVFSVDRQQPAAVQSVPVENGHGLLTAKEHAVKT